MTRRRMGLIGVPSSAGAHWPGQEKAPGVLRGAGLVEESRNERAPRSLDLFGALTATSGLASLIYAVSEVPQGGWKSTVTLGFGALRVLLLALFVVAERRSSAALVPLGVLGERAVVPNAAIFLQPMVGIAWLYVLTLHFQDVLGHGPLTAGFLFVPMTLVSVVAAPVAGRLATRLGVRKTASSGLALVEAVVYIIMETIEVRTHSELPTLPAHSILRQEPPSNLIVRWATGG